MLVFIVAAVVLLVGLALGALVVINYTAQLEFKSLAESIDKQLVAIRDLAHKQHTNLNLLVPAVQAYTTYEQTEFTALRRAAERLNKAHTPGQLQDANETANSAIDTMTGVCAYYPPLLISPAYLTANEHVSDTREHLDRAIVHYNTEVQRYNRKLSQFSNRLLARRVQLEPRYLIRATA